jgi:hypothetical protein
MSELRERFFVTRDGEWEGPPHDYVGYGEHPPHVRWRNDARVAVQIVVNADIEKHPALVARCVSVADVIACVNGRDDTT